MRTLAGTLWSHRKSVRESMKPKSKVNFWPEGLPTSKRSLSLPYNTRLAARTPGSSGEPEVACLGLVSSSRGEWLLYRIAIESELIKECRGQWLLTAN